jgi:hypothetical protein
MGGNGRATRKEEDKSGNIPPSIGLLLVAPVYKMVCIRETEPQFNMLGIMKLGAVVAFSLLILLITLFQYQVLSSAVGGP